MLFIVPTKYPVVLATATVNHFCSDSRSLLKAYGYQASEWDKKVSNRTIERLFLTHTVLLKWLQPWQSPFKKVART